MTEVIERMCAVCGEDTTITLAEDGEILSGGYYWPELLEGVGDDEPAEYWECEDCYEKPKAQLDPVAAEDVGLSAAADEDGDWVPLDAAESPSDQEGGS